MKKNITFNLVLLLSVSACAVQPTAQPTLDPNAFATMVYGTAQVLAAEIVAAAPSKTPTPMPTLTPTPSPTLALTSQGTALLRFDDNTWRFIDSKNGYELLIPPEWLTVRINEQEFFNAWSLPEANDPDMQRQLTSVQGQDPDIFRVFAFDPRAEHKQLHFIPNISVAYDANDTLPIADELETLKEAYSTMFTDIQDLSAEPFMTKSGNEIGIVEMSYILENTLKEQITIYQKQAIYKIPAGTVIITFSMTADVKDLLIDDITQVIESFTYPPNP